MPESMTHLSSSKTKKLVLLQSVVPLNGVYASQLACPVPVPKHRPGSLELFLKVLLYTTPNGTSEITGERSSCIYRFEAEQLLPENLIPQPLVAPLPGSPRI